MGYLFDSTFLFPSFSRDLHSSSFPGKPNVLICFQKINPNFNFFLMERRKKEKVKQRTRFATPKVYPMLLQRIFSSSAVFVFLTTWCSYMCVSVLCMHYILLVLPLLYKQEIHSVLKFSASIVSSGIFSQFFFFIQLQFNKYIMRFHS